jgi:hypothetical protein
MDNSNKVILDLCGGKGAWSSPYRKAGYNVEVLTLPEYNILYTQIFKNHILFRQQRLNNEKRLLIEISAIVYLLQGCSYVKIILWILIKSRKPLKGSGLW